MGRVRRYKKYKAIDPYAKRGKAELDTVHDEPPDLFEDRVNKKKRKERAWEEDEEQRDKFYQREALRALREQDNKSVVADDTKVEGKREGESMKAFKQRVKEQTKLTLRDELQKLTKTAQRRKEKLKEIKRKKKAKKNGDVFQEEVIEFGHAADGRIRASDYNTAPTEFKKFDSIKFGERVEQPPDLKDYTKELQRRQRLAAQRKAMREGKSIVIADAAAAGDTDDTAAATTKTKAQQKAESKKRLESMVDGGDDVGAARKDFNKGIFHSGGGKKATESEMEQLRARVQEAYKSLKSKRKEEAMTAQYGKGKKGFVMMLDHM